MLLQDLVNFIYHTEALEKYIDLLFNANNIKNTTSYLNKLFRQIVERIINIESKQSINEKLKAIFQKADSLQVQITLNELKSNIDKNKALESSNFNEKINILNSLFDLIKA